MSSDESSGSDGDDHDKAIKYHNKYVVVAEELENLKGKYNKLNDVVRKFQIEQLGEDLSNYKVFVDFFDAIALFPGKFHAPPSEFRLATVMSGIVREISPEEIKKINDLKQAVLQWGDKEGSLTNPFLKSINLLKKNLEEINFTALMSNGYIGPGDYNWQNMLAKKLNLNFKVPSTVSVDAIINSFPRMHETKMDMLRSTAVFAISHHYYALTERMAFWQDFQLLTKQYLEFNARAKVQPDVEPSIPLQPLKIRQLRTIKGKEKEIKDKKTTTFTSTEVTTGLRDQPVGRSFVSNYSQTEICTLKSTPSQTDIISIEMEEMIDANIPNLLNTNKRLTKLLELGKSDHSFEMKDLEEKKNKEIEELIRQHKNDLDTCEERNKKLKQELDDSEEREAELQEDIKEFQDKRVSLEKIIGESFKADIETLRKQNAKLEEKLKDQNLHAEVRRDLIEEGIKFREESIASSIVRHFISRGFRPDTNDDSEQWSTTAFLEDLFKSISYPFQEVLVKQMVAKEDLLSVEILNLQTRNKELTQLNEELTNKVLALEMDGNTHAKTLFENTMRIFEDKLFKNAVNNLRQVNDFSEKLRTDYTATQGMYDRMEAARRQLQSDLAKSQNIIHSFTKPRKTITETQIAPSHRFKDLPTLKGDETSEEMQLLKNVVRDNMAYNERIQLEMRPPNVSYKEWFSKFYQVVAKK